MALWDLNGDSIANVATEIRVSTGLECRCYVGDVSDREAVYKLAGNKWLDLLLFARHSLSCCVLVAITSPYL